MKKIAFVLIMLQSTCALAALPDCAKKAAKEFGVPEKIFAAIALESAGSKIPINDGRLYGPMQIFEGVIPLAAEGIQTSVDKIKADNCENYRAAAWLLMRPIQRDQNMNIWVAVNQYYYGSATRSDYPVTERVKAIYNSL
jgi:Transglycosylase SLT domain